VSYMRVTKTKKQNYQKPHRKKKTLEATHKKWQLRNQQPK
jgi:hypothetical protein